MKLENRKFALRGPASLLMFNGRLAFWSSDDPPVLIWLNSSEAAILFQFTGVPREAAEAAQAAGVKYDSEFNQLIDKLIRHRMLSEHVDACDQPFYPLYSPEVKKDASVCLVDEKSLSTEMIVQISQELKSSGLVGENPLSKSFRGTRGFGVKFRREAIDTLFKLLPWTRPYLEKALDDNVARHFCAGRSDVQPNAFYLNALVIPPGKGTGLHIDQTFNGRTTPILVSVLYLETTAPPGGFLYLTEKNWPVGLVNPRPGMMVHFRGNLAHGVAHTPSSGEVRSSLVCEQYFLSEEEIESCPYLQLVVR